VKDKNFNLPSGVPGKFNTGELVLTAILLGLALVLSLAESALPPLPLPMPGMRFGLANIAVMYALFFLGPRSSAFIVVLKALFAAFLRGPISGLLSLAGGGLSLLVMAGLLFVFRRRVSVLLISIFGAVFHNLGQLAAVWILYSNIYILWYLPALIVSGVAAGALTAALLGVAMPVLERAGLAVNCFYAKNDG
jgi:heptaprenyl diphosphate synthase